jgi:hypothetical protein
MPAGSPDGSRKKPAFTAAMACRRLRSRRRVRCRTIFVDGRARRADRQSSVTLSSQPRPPPRIEQVLIVEVKEGDRRTRRFGATPDRAPALCSQAGSKPQQDHRAPRAQEERGTGPAHSRPHEIFAPFVRHHFRHWHRALGLDVRREPSRFAGRAESEMRVLPTFAPPMTPQEVDLRTPRTSTPSCRASPSSP